MSEPLTDKQVDALKLAVAGVGEYAFTWRDKPHRLIYDAVNEIKRLRAELAEDNAILDFIVEHNLCKSPSWIDDEIWEFASRRKCDHGGITKCTPCLRYGLQEMIREARKAVKP